MEFVGIYGHDRPWASKVNDALNGIGGCWKIITVFLVQFLDVEAELTIQGYLVAELIPKREDQQVWVQEMWLFVEINAVKAESNQIRLRWAITKFPTNQFFAKTQNPFSDIKIHYSHCI